jgi:hypothetical protein
MPFMPRRKMTGPWCEADRASSPLGALPTPNKSGTMAPIWHHFLVHFDALFCRKMQEEQKAP